MIPLFILKQLEKCIQNKLYGELKIVFQNGVIQRFVTSESELAPQKGSETSINSGQLNQSAPKP